MTVLLTILKVIGIILLVLTAIILLILFVPVRYRANAAVNDPEPHEDFDPDFYKDRIQASAKVTWLFHLVTVTLLYPDREILAVRVAGIKVYSGLPSGKKKKPKKEKEKKPQEESEGGLKAKISALAGKVKKLYDRILYYKKALTCRSGKRAVDRLKTTFAALIKKLSPKEWEMSGTAGLGDPALSAQVLAVEGMLCPLTGGRMKLDADYQNWIFDVRLHAYGSFRICSVLAAALKLLFDKDVRKLLHRLRRGPAPKPVKETGKAAA